MLVLVSVGDPATHLFLLVILLTIASGCWIAWLIVRPWHCEAPGAGLAAAVLMVTISASTGLASMIPGAGNAAILAGITAVHAGASLETRRTVMVPLAGVAGVTVGCLLFARSPAVITIGFYAAALAGATLAGVVRGLRRVQFRQTTLLLDRELESRAEREHAAALAERARIAREIHDILAHSLADLCIQLEVADALLTDNADVAGAMRQVRRAHRLADDGLRETRRAVYALRRDTPPLPDTLAVMAAACGQAVFRLQGSPRPLPAAAGLALVRTAQEALVNARKYAAGLPINLCLQYDTDRVGLTVTDGQPSTTGNGSGSVPPTPNGELDGGYGLAGMRERLRLVGGSLAAGPVPGGWTVHAEVPA